VRATSSLLVPHSPPSASHARRRLVDELRARGIASRVVDDAALVISELVGNAVRHGAPLAAGGIRVAWTVTDSLVRVEVADGGRGPLRHEVIEPRPGGGSADAETGRGLAIVALLTTSWGSAFDSTSAVVWADVALRQSAEREAEQDAEADADLRREA
jgi:anti-sigma regulatory factor (Ser/Thr protein kinase)